MDILLITNIHERKGLYRDAMLLKGLLAEWGHQALMVDFRDGKVLQADLTIHLEVVEPRFLARGTRHWWIPNPEWAKPEYLARIDKFEHVLCKTKDAERGLSPFTDRTVLTGFVSEDRCEMGIERAKVFFHAYRGSTAKGTLAILAAWEGVTQRPLMLARNMEEAAFRRAQNLCMFHLCPSEYEGWGHSLHEALSVGAIVVSTNTPPMSETEGIAYLIDPMSGYTRCLAKCCHVDKTGVRRAADWCMGLTDEQIIQYSKAARLAFKRETLRFRRIFGRLIDRCTSGT